MSTPQELAGRARKVAAITRVLRVLRITADEAVTKMCDESWALAASEATRIERLIDPKAWTIHPPSEESIKAIVAELRKDEQLTADQQLTAPAPKQPDFPDESSWGPPPAYAEIQDPKPRRNR